MSGGDFPSNVQQTGNIIRILNARPENSGVYVCYAENSGGSDQQATIVEVERKYNLKYFSIIYALQGIFIFFKALDKENSNCFNCKLFFLRLLKRIFFRS